MHASRYLLYLRREAQGPLLFALTAILQPVGIAAYLHMSSNEASSDLAFLRSNGQAVHFVVTKRQEPSSALC